MQNMQLRPKQRNQLGPRAVHWNVISHLMSHISCKTFTMRRRRSLPALRVALALLPQRGVALMARPDGELKCCRTR